MARGDLSRIRGSLTALITPFKNGKVDEKAFQDFVAWQIAEGTKGLVPCGTTGESPTLSHEEHERVVELCVEAAAGKVPVVAGAGSNSTEEAIRLARHAAKVGADAALVICPYYNKPTQEGLYQHFKAVHDAADIPIIIYNVPPRTVTDMTVETMARLAKLPNIVGVKDATADLPRVSRLRVLVGDRFIQLSGEDATALGFNAHGGVGCISVTSNLAPRLCSEFQSATLLWDYRLAREIQDRLIALHRALFLETSPAPVKYGASLLGKSAPDVRLPLVGPTADTQDKVRVAMQAAGLIN
ncbi:MAG: 4-hydroxy-tetrahydrodipicolinate synthase [Alphaproteobacteria bacterium]|nr:4-hydroxy-tetrahydrodipicolinate synthase [Alphaproteobacteria bacterium]